MTFYSSIKGGNESKFRKNWICFLNWNDRYLVCATSKKIDIQDFIWEYAKRD